MKKIAIVTSVLLAVVFPRPSNALYFGVTEVKNQCEKNDYAIIYMNGVLNTEADAEGAKVELQRKLRWAGLDRYENHDVIVRKAFNPSHIAGIGDSITVALQKAFDQAQHTMGLDYDAKEMIDQMHREVKEGRMLFVAHSQGNFYANSIYNWLATREGGLGTSSMNMYNVASPAQMMTAHPRYILSKNDKVIAGLVGAVGNIAPPNVEFPELGSSNDKLGHNFVDTYLHYGGAQMVKDIRAQLATLEVDKGKDASLPCVPASDAGVAHALVTAFYALADPIANMGRNVLQSIGQFATVMTAPLFSGMDTSLATPLVGTTYLPDLRAKSSWTPPPFTPSTEFTPPAPVSLAPPLAREVTVKPKTGKPPLVDPDAALKLALLERIALLKRLLKAETKIATQTVASSAIRGSGSLPTARAHALDEASSTPVVLIPSVDWQVEDNLPVSHRSDAAMPFEGRLLITEYYIGKNGEASWVELMNTSDRWLDMRDAEFVDDTDRKAFPLTGLPPKKFVVLKSGGTMAHAILQSEAPYRVITGLRGGLRIQGEFVVLASRMLVDRAPYGGAYCANEYALRRSCERMVTVYPGDDPAYWVRARALETPTQYENASTIGYENQSWKYNIYEGRKIVGAYPNEVIPRGQDAVYVTGTIDVPAGETLSVANEHPWILALPDAAIFGGAGQTVIDVRGTLNIWKTGMIGVNKNFAEYHSEATKPVIETIPYILVHEGGVLVRDPYAFLNAPVVIRGGTVRVNTVAARMRLESGKLYLTYFNDGTSPPEIPLCDSFKNSYSPVEWLGGKLYRLGVDCGSSLFLAGSFEGEPYIGPDDPFGVVATLGDPYNCHIYYAVRSAQDCADYYGLPVELFDWTPSVAGTSTATTTVPIVPDATGATTATNTPPATNDTASSTATTTPVIPGGGGTESSGTPATSTPPISPSGDGTASTTSTSTPPVGSSGDVLGTSTASTTPPVGDGGGATSTPPIEGGDGSATSTATTTPLVGDGGSGSASSTASTTPQTSGEGQATSTPSSSSDNSATSTATSTPPAIDTHTSTSTASSTSPSGGGGTSATTTPGVFCYEGPTYYDGITLEELNATCGHGWAPRPTIFPITTWGRNPFEGRMFITEYYIGGEGEATWFKVSNMMGFAPVDLGVTDIFMGDTRVPFPVLSILARQFVIVRSDGTLVQAIPSSSLNGGAQTTLEYDALVLPLPTSASGTIRFSYTTGPRFPGTDVEVLDFERGVCPGVITEIGSCVLLRPYMVGNYPGDGGYVPWSMPDTTPTTFSPAQMNGVMFSASTDISSATAFVASSTNETGTTTSISSSTVATTSVDVPAKESGVSTTNSRRTDITTSTDVPPQGSDTSLATGVSTEPPSPVIPVGESSIAPMSEMSSASEVPTAQPATVSVVPDSPVGTPAQ